MDDIQHKIGTAFMDIYGGYCLEVVNGNYDLDTLYDGGKKWGNFDRVFLALAVVRGAKSYSDYLDMFNQIKPEDHQPVTKQMFARFTGISTVEPKNQVIYNETYRKKTKAELEQLRTLNAMAWIDNNTKQAQEYIDKITSVN